MAYHVVITGMHPLMNAAECQTAESAEVCAAYLRDMFPHLRGGLIEIMDSETVAAFTANPVSGFVKDSMQSYITTGNGYPRPVSETVILGGAI